MVGEGNYIYYLYIKFFYKHRLAENTSNYVFTEC